MAKVKAKVSFAGIVTMGAGEEREILDENIVKDLLSAGYVEELAESAPKVAKKSATKTKGDK